VFDLGNVMQFEIDRTFQNFKPHFHYGIDHSEGLWVNQH
jgi:hypothetical protein